MPVSTRLFLGGPISLPSFTIHTLLDEASLSQPSRNMQLNPAEISELIKSRIEGLGVSANIRNEGTVVSVTDGIVRVHGLSDAMDSLDIKQVLPFEHGLHQHLKSNHASLLAKMEKDGAKWKTKSGKDDAPEKVEFAKSCQAAEAELREAIAAFKKSFA